MAELDPTSWFNLPLPVLLVSAVGLVVGGTAYLAARRFSGLSSEEAAAARAAAVAAEVEDLAAVEKALYGNAMDRRMAPRRKGHSVAVVLAGPSDDDVLAGWVEDRSSGGMSVWVESAVAVGAVLKVRSRELRASDRIPWAEVRVRTCRSRPGGFRLGCQFTQLPAWNVLLTFG